MRCQQGQARRSDCRAQLWASTPMAKFAHGARPQLACRRLISQSVVERRPERLACVALRSTSRSLPSTPCARWWHRCNIAYSLESSGPNLRRLGFRRPANRPRCRPTIRPGCASVAVRVRSSCWLRRVSGGSTVKKDRGEWSAGRADFSLEYALRLGCLRLRTRCAARRHLCDRSRPKPTATSLPA